MGKIRFGIVALAAVMLVPGAGSADTLAVDFEAPTYGLGAVHGQDGWSSLGSVGSGCALYDVEVVDATAYPYEGLGEQALRISNARTSGCFGDQTFSKSLADEAGEPDADAAGMSGGTRQSYFSASWTFASTKPNHFQKGLQVVASPDRGDGARMSWIQMTDSQNGIDVNFFGYDSTLGGTCSDLTNFVFTQIADGLDRTQPHTIEVEMFLLEGNNNDIVRVYIDGELAHEGKSWEDFFRLCQPIGGTDAISRTVDSVLFRVAGAARPIFAGRGFLIDNFASASRLLGTSIVADPVVELDDLPVLDLAATLTSELGEPLEGKTVEFRAGASETLCTDVTDASGHASCEALPSLVPLVLALGYTADFNGDAVYEGSEDDAELIVL